MKQDALLKTKLYVPPVRPDLVPRPHLIQRLDNSLRLRCKLTLLSAPAGFGKTTLLGEWVSHLKRAGQTTLPESRSLPLIGWLSLDQGDDDPIRFIRYLSAALQHASTKMGRDVFPSPQPPLQSLSVQALAAAYINQIDATEGQIVLVLDDYHQISSPKTHDALAFLLDRLPPNLHLVLATRHDPPLQLSRLRGRGQLAELRQRDLRFSEKEVGAFLGQAMDLQLATDDVATLASHTEGWPTGVQIAALAMQQKVPSSVPAFLSALSGRHAHMVDYFAAEVLSLQHPAVTDFLLQTSILDRLSGTLCDAVRVAPPRDTGRRSGQQMLERLQETNLFIVPLDEERQWYRYHTLFADFLRQRLALERPDSVPGLHHRASEWFAHRGHFEEAIQHALLAADPERAAQLVEEAAEPALMRCEVATVKDWLAALPREIVQQRPLLSLYSAVVHMLSGAPAARFREHLTAAAAPDRTGSVTQGATGLRALLALWQGDIDRSLELGGQALASLPEHNHLWRGIIALNLGIAMLHAGRDQALAGRMLGDAARMSERAGNQMGAVIAFCSLAELRSLQGQLPAARTLYDRALDLAVDDQGRNLSIGGMPVAGIAGLLQEWNELEEAAHLLVTAIKLTGEGLPIWAVDAYMGLARVRQSQGDLEAAQKAIDQARSAAAATGATELDDRLVAAHQARLWIARGHLDFAARWARSLERIEGLPAGMADSGSSLYALDELEGMVMAELRLAQGHPERAREVLAALLAESTARQRTDSVIKILILMALAQEQQNLSGHALAALSQALSRAHPGGYVRAFLDRGRPMENLLRLALGEGVAIDYVQALLAACDATAEPAADSQAWVERLSDRELQVLRLLATHLTSAEIGNALFISTNTVRFHTKNIYGKLDVHSRGDAVQRAESLGLL